MDQNCLKLQKKKQLKSNIIGLGVGLYADYGAAQRLYVRKGYIPDGLGITYKGQHIKPGLEVCLDDDLVLFFMKKLNGSDYEVLNQ